MVPTVEWKDGAVRLLDQSRLPESVEFLDCRDYQTVAEAIRSLKVRGAPAIGVTAAMGVALGAQTTVASDYEAFAKAVLGICDHLSDQADGGQSVLGYRTDEAPARVGTYAAYCLHQSYTAERVTSDSR